MSTAPKAALHFSDAQIEMYRSQILELQKEALEQYHSYISNNHFTLSRVYRPPWKIIAQAENLVAYTMPGHNISKLNPTQIFGQIHGDFQQIMNFFHAETAYELSEWSQYMFHQVVDANVVCNIDTQWKDWPSTYLGIKYIVSQAPRYKMTTCFIEYMTYTKDDQNRTIGIRIVAPITWNSSIAPAWENIDVSIMECRTVYIFRGMQNRPAETQIFVLGDPEFGGLINSTTCYKWQLERLRKISVYMESKEISRRGMLGRNDWVPDTARPTCNVCRRKFNAARHRHHCRMCGEVICRKCIVLRSIGNDMRTSQAKKLKTKFCVACVTNLRQSNSISHCPTELQSQFSRSHTHFPDSDEQRKKSNSRTSHIKEEELFVESLIRCRKSDTPLSDATVLFEDFLNAEEAYDHKNKRSSTEHAREVRKDLLADERQRQAVKATDLWLRSYKQPIGFVEEEQKASTQRSFYREEVSHAKSCSRRCKQNREYQKNEKFAKEKARSAVPSDDSLNQRIAEQEALLQRLVSALHSHQSGNAFVSPYPAPSSNRPLIADFSSGIAVQSDEESGYFDL